MELTMKQFMELQSKDKRIPITRGCDVIGGCFCSGRCKDVIGYWENGVYTAVESPWDQKSNVYTNLNR